MTSAEIIGNIRYNEDLVAQFQQEVNNFETKIDELYRLRKKYCSLQEDFALRQSKRKSSILSLVSGQVSVNVFKKYLKGMEQLLDGDEYKNAYNGLGTAMEKIDREISKLQSELNESINKRDYRRQRIGYWEEQLKYADDLQGQEN